MGKGIEDISHYFISMREASNSGVVDTGTVTEKSPPLEIHRMIAVISKTPGIPGLAWSAFLSLALSQCEKKILLMDIGSEPQVLSGLLPSVPVLPSLNALLEQSDKAIARDSSAGVRVLSFQFHTEELQEFRSEEREILFQMLRREERQADILLSNIEFDLLNSDSLRPVRYFDEVILMVPQEDLQEIYGVLKVLYLLNPNLRVGMIDTGGPRENGSTGAQNLAIAAHQFLQKSPVVLGQIPQRLNESGNRALKYSMEFFSRDEWKEDLAVFGRGILEGLNGPKDGQLLFEKIDSKITKTS
jgi:hypothetical protein